MLHVSERTTFRYIHDKKLNAKKIGGAWRVTSADLKAFLAGEAPEVLRAVEKDMVGKRDSLTKADIKRVCDILRRDDGVGAKDYIEQFSWLLFLKVFEGVEAQLKELEEAEGRKYKSVIDAEYQWSAWAKKDWKDKDELIHFINQKLFPYLQTLQGDPRRDKIGQIFRELPGNRIRSPHNLLDVIDILNKIEKHHFQDTNLLSQVYEEILQAMGSEGGWSGEFYSPRPLIRLMVKIVNPMLGETVLDPFVGSGGFLVESFNHIYENSAKDVRAWKTLQTKTLYGQEKKPLPFLIGTMNLILHHVLVPNLVRTNTFMEDVHNTPESEKVNVILTNPPFGAEESKAVQNNYPIQVGATEGLALQYVMKRLKNGGRCGIILPEGNVLFGGGAMARIREELLTKFNVSAIISLPQGTFSQMGTGIKTNLIFFEKTGGTKEIWYGEVKGKFTKKKTVQDSDLYEVFEKWKKRENSDTSWTVPIATIKEQGYNILPKNPNTTNEMFESPDELIQALENGQSAVEKAIQSLGSLYRKLSVTSAGQRYSLTELFDRLPAGRKYSKKEVRDEGKVPVIDQSQSDVFGYHNLKPDIHASEGEPVITFANHTRAVRYMTHDFSVIQNVFPLRAKAVILPRFGYYLLQEVVPNEGYKGHWPLLEKMSFSIPDLKSQAEIVKIADAIWEHISELQKQVGKQHSDLMLFRSSFLLSIFQAEDK